MEQKQVNLIGLRVQNNGIISAAELTPDIFSKRLILVTGETGNGKSTLLNSAMIATSGTDAIKKSDILPDGFIAEARLLDGDVPIFIGVKTGKVSRGERAGERKLETYLYTKDANGKAIAPVIDGVQWTATQYWKALTTELTYALGDLFSENQTTHRKLIEKLFKTELEAIHADKIIAEIDALRKNRDAKRLICQSNGAYMERFNDEGWTEQNLSLLKRQDVEALRTKKTNLEIEKATKVRAPQTQYELEKLRLDTEREKALGRIKDAINDLLEKKRQEEMEVERFNAALQSEYTEALQKKEKVIEFYQNLRESAGKFIGYKFDEEQRNEQGLVYVYPPHAGNIIEEIDKFYLTRYKAYTEVKEPVKKEVSSTILKAIEEKKAEYETLAATPIDYPAVENVDVSDIEKKITLVESEILAATSTNALYDRYQLWIEWIEAKEKYEAKLGELRKLYASIETGVPGMKIVPRDTDSGKVEVWVMYDATYNPEYFNNPNKEMRFMFDYSSFQRTIIGLMLQAARLDLKPRALRLAYIDDVAFTTRDVAVLGDVAERLDLKLITAWTHEADKENLIEGQVLVEGGEIFFN